MKVLERKGAGRGVPSRGKGQQRVHAIDQEKGRRETHDLLESSSLAQS